MKRFGQKVLAFFMAAVMLLAMAGCKKESETLFDGMRQALKMNGYEVEMGMTIEAEGQNITIKADGVVDRQAQACQLSVSAKAAGMRLNLGVVTVTDGFMYFELSEDVLELMGVTEEDILDSLEMLGLEAASATVYGLEIGTMEKEAVEAGNSISEHMISMLEAGASEAEGCVTGEKGVFQMKVSEKELPDLLSGMIPYLKENLDEIWDAYITVMEAGMDNKAMKQLMELAGESDLAGSELNDMESILEEAKDSRDELKDALENAEDWLEELREALDEIVFDMNLDFSITGKKNSKVCDMTLSMEAEAEGEEFDIEITSVMKETKVEIQAPEEYTEMLDLIELFVDLSGDDMFGVGTDPGFDDDTGFVNGDGPTDHAELITSFGDVIAIYAQGDFVYDAESSDSDVAFFDYDNGDMNWALVYLYDYDFDEEDYWEEIQSNLEYQKESEDYDNVAVSDYTKTMINGYEVNYAVVTYTFADAEEVHHDLYAFAEIGDEYGISIELATYSDEEWQNIEGGNPEAILGLIVNGIQ